MLVYQRDPDSRGMETFFFLNNGRFLWYHQMLLPIYGLQSNAYDISIYDGKVWIVHGAGQLRKIWR